MKGIISFYEKRKPIGDNLFYDKKINPILVEGKILSTLEKARINREKEKMLIDELLEESKNYNKNLMDQPDYPENLMGRLGKMNRNAERAITRINLQPLLKEKQNALRNNSGKILKLKDSHYIGQISRGPDNMGNK